MFFQVGKKERLVDEFDEVTKVADCLRAEKLGLDEKVQDLTKKLEKVNQEIQ